MICRMIVGALDYNADEVVLRATPSIEAPVRARLYDAQSGALSQEIALAPEGDAYVARTRLPPGANRA